MGKKRNLAYLTPSTKINLKWTLDMKVKQTVKCLKEDIIGCLCGQEVGEGLHRLQEEYSKGKF